MSLIHNNHYFHHKIYKSYMDTVLLIHSLDDSKLTKNSLTTSEFVLITYALYSVYASGVFFCGFECLEKKILEK